MNDRGDELFEAELQKLVPAQPPARLMARLASIVPRPSPLVPRPSSWLFFRWLAPAAAVVGLVGALLWWLANTQVEPQGAKPATALIKASPKADAVEIDRQLVALFDAVAELPNGQPVRFRCREWADEVVLRDPARGLVIESRMPRFEVVPIRFETY